MENKHSSVTVQFLRAEIKEQNWIWGEIGWVLNDSSRPVSWSMSWYNGFYSKISPTMAFFHFSPAFGYFTWLLLFPLSFTHSQMIAFVKSNHFELHSAIHSYTARVWVLNKVCYKQVVWQLINAEMFRKRSEPLLSPFVLWTPKWEKETAANDLAASFGVYNKSLVTKRTRCSFWTFFPTDLLF